MSYKCSCQRQGEVRSSVQILAARAQTSALTHRVTVNNTFHLCCLVYNLGIKSEH